MVGWIIEALSALVKIILGLFTTNKPQDVVVQDIDPPINLGKDEDDMMDDFGFKEEGK